jgi:hypothetical protein
MSKAAQLRNQLNLSYVEIYQRSIGPFGFVPLAPNGDGPWNCNFSVQLVVRLFFQNTRANSMRTFIRSATLAFALVTSVPVVNAQSLVTQQPYDAFIVQPSGTLVGQMPFVTIPEGVLRPVQTVQTSQPEHVAPPVQTVRTSQPEHVTPPVQTVQTSQPEHVAPPIALRRTVATHHVIVHHVATGASEHVVLPIARHQIVASHHLVAHVATTVSSRPLYDYVALAPVVTPVVMAPAPAPTAEPVLNVSGQFQCVEGCAGGLPGTAFVTQNGWDLNLVNELGQPSRAWIDRPGHIWAQNWNEGAIYSPDGMTIQFDNGTVWRRNIELMVLRPIPSGR